MSDFESILDFLEPVNVYELSDDEGYRETQLGAHVLINDDYFPNLDDTDFVMVGFGESRGLLPSANINAGPIACDYSGNLYISSGDRIRKVTPAGIITTVAGTGSSTYVEMGVPQLRLE